PCVGAGQRMSGGCHVSGVLLKFLRLEPGREGHPRPRTEDLGRECEIADGIESEMYYRLLDTADRPRMAEEGRIHDMQDLGGLGAVRGDDLRDLPGARALARHDVAQTGIDARQGWELADTAHGCAHARLPQQILQLHTALDDLLEPLRLTRLGNILVGERYEPNYLPLLGIARQHDPDRLRGLLACDLEKLRSVHLGHTHVGYDRIVVSRLELLERERAARDEAHLPLRPRAVEAPPQPLEERRLVVDE